MRNPNPLVKKENGNLVPGEADFAAHPPTMGHGLPIYGFGVSMVQRVVHRLNDRCHKLPARHGVHGQNMFFDNANESINGLGVDLVSAMEAEENGSFAGGIGLWSSEHFLNVEQLEKAHVAK